MTSIPLSNACAYPGTVMIISGYTMPADNAMLWPQRLVNIADLAIPLFEEKTIRHSEVSHGVIFVIRVFQRLRNGARRKIMRTHTC